MKNLLITVCAIVLLVGCVYHEGEHGEGGEWGWNWASGNCVGNCVQVCNENGCERVPADEVPPTMIPEDPPCEDEESCQASRCIFDADCAQGRCLDGECRTFCAVESECHASERCEGGICQPDEGNQCTRNADCVGGICANGICFDHCQDSLECSSGEFCQQGVCRPDTRAVPECTRNRDCGEGQVCFDARCFSACECDDDCGADRFCVAGACVTQHDLSPECARNTDCGASDVCLNGRCQ